LIFLEQSGVVLRIWQPEIETIQFQAQDGSLVDCAHKGKTKASGWTGTNRWWLERPYDFVIDTKRNIAKGKKKKEKAK
jgi:hypothetical protein